MHNGWSAFNKINCNSLQQQPTHHSIKNITTFLPFLLNPRYTHVPVLHWQTCRNYYSQQLKAYTYVQQRRRIVSIWYSGCQVLQHEQQTLRIYAVHAFRTACNADVAYKIRYACFSPGQSTKLITALQLAAQRSLPERMFTRGRMFKTAESRHH